MLSMHEATVEMQGRKNSLLTGRNLQQNQIQEGQPSVSTSRGLRGQDRGVKKHNNTWPRIPVQAKEKRKGKEN